MDRVEAYALLSERLAQMGSKDSLEELPDSFSLSEDVSGSIDGMLYTIDMRVERDNNGVRILLGSIHDNNPAKFSLLEERKSLAY